MIAMLSGTIAHKSPESIILDVNGVGYRVQIPFSTYYELPECGDVIVLHVFTHVKEDAINLYGFRSLPEKVLFQLLISVSGVGPKLGKDILSNIEVDDLTKALAEGNLARLSSVPGIGKKTAERLVLELKTKVAKLDLYASPKQKTETVSSVASVADDVTSALMNLGYKEPVVRKVLAGMEIGVDLSVEELLKSALRVLMK